MGKKKPRPKLKKKRRKGAGKGAQFERVLCRQLSTWWSDGRRDDLFWRSSQSGGRATRRTKRGKKTAGSYGDIMSMGLDASLLTTFVTIELKCGYNTSTIHDLIDGAESSKQQYSKWIEQAEEASHEAMSQHWWLIHKRDRRDPILVTPYGFWNELGHTPENALFVEAMHIIACPLEVMWRIKPKLIKELNLLTN